MRVLLTGGSGIVGWTILNRISTKENIFYTFFDTEVTHPFAQGFYLDIRDPEQTIHLCNKLDPDTIIHAAAMTDVDECEANPERAREVNVEGTRTVVDAADQCEANLVFISSSFVFNGVANPYRIEDTRDPVNIYGETKADAERLVETKNVSSSIVRTDQPYGWTKPWQSPTMVEWTIDELSKDGSVEIFNDWFNVPTYLPDLADAIIKIVEMGETGKFHAVGPNYISRYAWAIEIAKTFGFDTSRIKSVSSSDADILASRPNVNLRNDSVKGLSGLTFRGIQDGLKYMLSMLD